MNRSFFSISIFALLVVIFCASDQAYAKKKTYEVPVVVNILNDTNFTPDEAKDMIKRMNKIYKKAGITLTVAKIIPNVSIGNGNGKLSKKERKAARKKAKEELETYTKGKGMKIWMCDMPFYDEPNTVGYAGHYSRSVFVQPDKIAEANEPEEKAKITAATAAHELVHAWTVCRPNDGHSTDPNDLMYDIIQGGTNLRPSDVTEIRGLLKKRQKAAKKKAATTKKAGKVAVADKSCTAGMWAVEFDDINDVTVTLGDPQLFDPNDERFWYADIEDVEVWRPDLFSEIDQDRINFAFMPGGVFPEVESFESFFDIYYDFYDLNPGPEFIIEFHVWRIAPAAPMEITAELQDSFGMPLMGIPDVNIEYNTFLDLNMGGIPEPFNHRIECNIPADFFGPGSEVFNNPIKLSASSRVIFDERLPSLELEDNTAEFVLALEQPDEEPTISVTPANTFEADGARYVMGNGFEPGSLISIIITPEDEAIDVIERFATADDDGNFSLHMDPQIPGGIGEYYLYAAADIDGGPGIARVSGLFTDGPVSADLDEDDDVDFCDFAVFAEQWLDGVE